MVLFDFFTMTEVENVLICQTPFVHYWHVLLALHGHEIFILIHESSLFQLLLVSNWSRFHRYYYLFFLPWMDTPFLSSRLLFNVKMKNFSLQKYFLYSLRESSRFYMYISGAAVDPVLISEQQLSVLTDYVSFLESWHCKWVFKTVAYLGYGK